MAGLEKSFKDIRKRTKDSFKNPEAHFKSMDPTRQAKDMIGDVTSAFSPEIPEPEEDVIIPIPDEGTAQLEARKRRAKTARTGRESTILTEGLGG